MRLEISCEDRLGITQEILDILLHRQIDLRGIEVDAVGKIFLSFPNISFSDFQELMPKIRLIQGVDDVKTIPFMPMEREQNQLRALLHNLPDPVFSIDTKGKVFMVNDAVSQYLVNDDAVIGTEIELLVTGFNFQEWRDAEVLVHSSAKVSYQGQEYLAEISPVLVEEGDGEAIVAGGLVMLKSEQRLGQQFNLFHRPAKDSFEHIVNKSPAMKKVVKEAKRMAELEGHILFFGETGTGKEMFARACHNNSRRAEAPFLALNCAALPDNVAETELFGYGPGAFGQSEAKAGLLEQAQGGSLYLDEVGGMSEQMQNKLLRVLEDSAFRRIGDGSLIPIDVRFICSTQKDLGQLVQDGDFREDLFYRLNVLSLVIPPLRERRADIVPLAEHFIRQHSMKLGQKPPKLAKDCIDFLQHYHWPGNIRQLENTLYRAVSLSDEEQISKAMLQLPQAAGFQEEFVNNFDASLEEQVKSFEKSLLRRLYPSYPSTRQLAKKLGLSHTAIANKLREYGINKDTVKY